MRLRLLTLLSTLAVASPCFGQLPAPAVPPAPEPLAVTIDRITTLVDRIEIHVRVKLPPAADPVAAAKLAALEARLAAVLARAEAPAATVTPSPTSAAPAPAPTPGPSPAPPTRSALPGTLPVPGAKP